MTIKEVALLAGITRQAVASHRGALNPTKIGGAVVYDRAIVERWLASRASSSARAPTVRHSGQPSKLSSGARAALERTAAARAAMAIIDEGDTL